MANKTAKPRRNRRSPGTAPSAAVPNVLPDMLFRLNRKGEYLAFEPGNGVEPYVSPEELLGKTIHDVLPAYVADEALPVVERALDTGETQVISYTLDMEDGEHSYTARIVALSWDQALAIVRDTTVHPVGTPEPRSTYGLTNREMMVLRLAATGGTDKQIAAELHISPMTVRKHIAHILRRMDAFSRTEACVRAVREGILD